MSYNEEEVLVDPDLDEEEKPLDIEESMDLPEESDDEYDPDNRYH